jgi:hypothetical protein
VVLKYYGLSSVGQELLDPFKGILSCSVEFRTLSIVPSWTTSIATRSFVMISMDSKSNDLANPSYLLPLITSHETWKRVTNSLQAIEVSDNGR